jgi:hypothetical protein
MSNDGIEPDELWEQTTALPITAPKTAPNTRQLVTIGASAFVVMLIVGLILTLSLGGNDTSTANTTTSTSSSTSVASSTTLPASIATTLVPTTVEETTTTSTTAVEFKYVAQPITIAGSQGISHIAGGTTTRFDSQSWETAFRLADGSYIAQRSSVGYGQQTDTTIYRVGATTTVVKSVIDPAAEWLRLHDVYSEGSVADWFVLYSLSSGFGMVDSKEELFALSMETGLTTSLGVIGGWESSTSRLRFGSNIIVGQFSAEADTGPFFLHLDGYTTNPNDFGLADSYSDCSVCPSRFTIDPSGQRLAWIEADLLVVLDRTSTTRIAEIRLPQGLYLMIDSIEIFGDLILINVYEPNTGKIDKPILMSFAGTSTTLDTAGTATFDRPLNQ